MSRGSLLPVNQKASDPGGMVLTSLELTNFRRFEHLTMELEPDLTVVVSANGGGKTAVLDGLTVALHALVDTLRGAPVKGFAKSDVRLVRTPDASMVHTFPTSLLCRSLVDGQVNGWRRTLKSIGGKTSWGDLFMVKDVAAALATHLQDYATRKRPDAPSLPVVACYGTGRLWSRHNVTAKKVRAAKDSTLQLRAYDDALSASSSFESFARWFENVYREAVDEFMTSVPSPHRPGLILDAVRGAVDVVLKPSGWHQLEWDFTTQEVSAHHPQHGILPVSALSDGIRNLIGLVADLAHRAVRLNPHLGAQACVESTGIVLLDEVDMHLHPAWQQQIVPTLREAFPKIQFVVTTHSALVISTVPRRSIRILTEEGKVIIPDAETEGYDGAFALRTVFGVDTDPPGAVADKLSALREMIERGEGHTPPATAVKQELVEHFGAGHPAITSTAAFQRLQDFKSKKAVGGG